MQGENKLHQLEQLRRQLEDANYAVGELYVYVDRGSPSDGQRQIAWGEIDQGSHRISSLEAALETLVAELRGDDPKLLEAWVEAHQAMYREIEAAYDGSEKVSTPIDPEVATFITNHAIRKWEEVRQGEATYVLGNRQLLQQHEEIVRRHLDF
jgi:hypothetical protein